MKHSRWTQIGAIFTTLVLAMVVVMPSAASARTTEYELAANTPGHVAISEVENSKGIAYLIPQYHRYPGSKVTDSRNDRAEVAQKQIYQIIKDIVNKGDADLVMVEGELAGDVPESKKEKLQTQMEQFKKFEGINKLLATKSNGSKFGKLLKQRFGSLERSIYLAGAAQVLWAQDADITLVGAENLDTQKESAKLVKNYVNLQNKVKSNKGGQMQQMLTFANESDLTNNDLKAKLAQSEEEIQEVVVERRNRETAENFVKALGQHNEVSGIIQFGAGHTLGLVDELNKRGLTVVTIVPDVVYEDKIKQKQKQK